jgi:hypothetical protein
MSVALEVNSNLAVIDGVNYEIGPTIEVDQTTVSHYEGSLVAAQPMKAGEVIRISRFALEGSMKPPQNDTASRISHSERMRNADDDELDFPPVFGRLIPHPSGDYFTVVPAGVENPVPRLFSIGNSKVRWLRPFDTTV